MGFLAEVISLVLEDAGYMNFERSRIPECRHVLSLDAYAIGLNSGLEISPTFEQPNQLAAYLVQD